LAKKKPDKQVTWKAIHWPGVSAKTLKELKKAFSKKTKARAPADGRAYEMVMAHFGVDTTKTKKGKSNGKTKSILN